MKKRCLQRFFLCEGKKEKSLLTALLVLNRVKSCASFFHFPFLSPRRNLISIHDSFSLINLVAIDADGWTNDADEVVSEKIL